MVSPLQTWQHPQPRYLWPVLGGLSVLTHVGLLGLSLPYVIELMQPNGDQSAAIATPVELVVVAPTDSPTVRTSAAASEATIDTLIETAPEAPSSNEPEASSEDGSGASSAEPPNTDRPPSDPAESRPTPDSSDFEETAPADEGPSPPERQESVEPSNNQLSSDQTPSGDQGEAEAPETDSEPLGLPTIPRDQSLEPPSDSAGTESEQAAALSIVSHRQVPEQFQRDIADTPPVPRYDAAQPTITLRPSEYQCQRIAFPQPVATYRVAIRPDGTMARATPWTEGESRDLSDSEKAIACLLESAGFAFEPARIEGEPVLNDNLLLTVEVTESR